MNTQGNSHKHPTVADLPTRRVTVRVGLFFDGTGNNRINSQIGTECREQMHRREGHTRECAGRHEKIPSSYSNDLSNIARLAGLYRQQATAVHEHDGWKVCWPVYISGAGTTSGGRDSLLTGQSFGRGTTGVLAKVERAISRLGAGLRDFARDNPGCLVEALELDVFGFSRGAASARHLVNEVLKQSRGDLAPLLAEGQLPLSPEFAWSRGSVRVRFVGLFDTVAAIGGLRDLGNVRDFNNRRVNLYLPPGCAQHVLHLVARDEWRRNFALNSILPVWPREIVLPGAHSDIGGGYHPQMLEEVLLTRPRTGVTGRDVALQDSPAWHEAMDELQAMDYGAWLDPQDPQASLQVQCSPLGARTAGNGFGNRLVMASVCMRRQVSGHLSRVHLRLMHALACDEGVPFEPIGDAAHLQLPAELEEVAQRLISQARGEGPGLTPEQEQWLRWRYIHHSAHWSPIIGTLGSLGNALFVHAPQPGGRALHPNVAQPGYPY